MPPTVLIIEDDPATLDILREGLADEGYRAIGVARPEEAAAALRGGGFDLVLTDAFRPTATDAVEARWATLEAIRAAAGDVPVVIVTAHRLDDYAAHRERGFAGVLGKPFDLDTLYALVGRVVLTTRPAR